MKIKQQLPDEKEFKDIQIGDVFIYNRLAFLKVEPVKDHDTECVINCIRVDQGLFTYISPTDKVEVPKSVYMHIETNTPLYGDNK